MSTYEIHYKERFYFGLKLIFSIFLYALLAIFLFLKFQSAIKLVLPLLIYIVFVLLALHIYRGLLIGYLRGNAIKVTTNQFPEVYETVVKQCRELGLSTIPTVYVLQSGGLLNAFASKFGGRSFIVLYSEVVEEVYNQNKEAVDFVIAHELGHVKQKHLLKNTLLFPSAIIPFLQPAYSRGCEYTCDNIGAALSPKGARNGLCLLVAGKQLYTKVKMESIIAQNESEGGFWAWIAEKLSSHPRLTYRIARYKGTEYDIVQFKKQAVVVEQTNDHSRYMPT